jgi:pSer/pThr/pTyr-binding forkhead associated (FHA) protein
VSDQVLTLLKYVVLALLYLFFLRVLRAVWVELREPKPAPVPLDAFAGVPPTPERSPAPTATPVAGGESGPAAVTRAVATQAGAQLVIIEPAERRGQQFRIAQEVTIGRAPGCAISLPEDTYVSQLHARVFRRDGELWVEDLGSTNGTLLNSTKVTAAVALHHGDQLQVGSTVLECVE